MEVWMRIRRAALPTAVVAALLATGTALAWPSNSISVETNGCDYTIRVTQEPSGTFIGWEVRVFAASPLTGDLVASGSGTADAAGNLTVGPLTAAPGQYNALLDFALPATGDAEVRSFTLTCESATEAPTTPPTEAPTTPPTEAPTT